MCFRCSLQGFTALSWDWLKQNLLQLLMRGPFCRDQGGWKCLPTRAGSFLTLGDKRTPLLFRFTAQFSLCFQNIKLSTSDSATVILMLSRPYISCNIPDSLNYKTLFLKNLTENFDLFFIF